ncbi:carbon-nitrogen hydrolase family protein [Leptothrix discophora]|uniref:Carbon-nitrogen hydrolase family protein n=1 Tax=Leptothrix discophora TaxID=89 RepID=A0ABT9G4A9_LEPDI|nr:carbon-nitrogen hydrolase family protein [Leptothrix discophora]MDP4301325.1 carbon-nitrogen hydrolase family protein [Leptothrix discophora]
MTSSLAVAAVQMVSSPDVADNLVRAGRLIAQAAAAGAELVALPEYFCLMGHKDRDKLAIAEPAGDGPIQAALAGWAAQHGIWLVGGTLPLRIAGDPDHASNTCLAYAPDGSLAARYDKIHLFRYDDGERRYDEAATLCAGSQPVAFDIRSRAGTSVRVGLSTCYDLRFPELYRALMSPQSCDLFVMGAAFTWPTGQAHWDVLLRARAIENQCHVLASAQGGTHANGRRTWGHSLVIDPWGVVQAVQPEGEGVVMGQVDLARQGDVRRQLPALAHRVM